ncbi:hypothetical protein ACS0TY_016549 [Phlomoides rotata]
MPGQASHLNILYLLRYSDYLSNLRMDQNTFVRPDRVTLRPSSLKVVLKLNYIFLVTPTPVPDDHSVNLTWKIFRHEICLFLPGWEGSTTDFRVLRPCSFTAYQVTTISVTMDTQNSEGFLSPYRGCRFYLKEWGPIFDLPTNQHEHLC